MAAIIPRMCGRFTLATPPEVLAALFDLDGADWNDPRYNVAPQTRVVTVRGARGRRSAQALLWGTPNPHDSRPVINARSETVATSPLFSRAFAQCRILVPADGFFEWTKVGAKRQGHYLQRPGLGPFAFAGVAVAPRASLAEGVPGEPAAVILTTAASPSVREIHHRMPVVIEPDDFDLWLDPAGDVKRVIAAVARAAATEWVSHPVGAFVNNVRHDGPENVRFAVPPVDPQGRLF